MEELTVAWTSTPLSRLAFGCAAMGGYDYGPVDDANSIVAVRTALDLGIRVFDTADVYGLGRAEEVLGRALAGRRSEAVIATKGGVQWDADGATRRTLDPAYLVAALEASLQRLRTDRIDLYQFHWPVPGADFDHVMEALARCRDDGKILAIGCCNFGRHAAARLARSGDLVSEQLGFNALDRGAADDLQAAVDAGRITFTYNSLAQGMLSRHPKSPSVFEGSDLRTRYGYFQSSETPRHLAVIQQLKRIADVRGRSILQVALRWALDQPFVKVAIAGVKHAWQIEEIVGASNWVLTLDEHRAIDAVATRLPE